MAFDVLGRNSSVAEPVGTPFSPLHLEGVTSALSWLPYLRPMDMAAAVPSISRSQFPGTDDWGPAVKQPIFLEPSAVMDQPDVSDQVAALHQADIAQPPSAEQQQLYSQTFIPGAIPAPIEPSLGVTAPADRLIGRSTVGIDEPFPAVMGPHWLPETTVAQTSSSLQLVSLLQGELALDDDYNPQRFGVFKDDYELLVMDQSQLQLGLMTSVFDAYLQIIDPQTGEVIAFDDDSGQGTDAQLDFVGQAGDRLIIRVTSYGFESIGAYRLSLSSDHAMESPLSPDDDLLPDDPEEPNPVIVDGNIQPDPTLFNPSSGYGFVDGATAVAAALNLAQPERNQTFPAESNLGGLHGPLDSLGVPEVWAQGFTGEGVVVAVIDSGVDFSHPELQDNRWVNTAEIPGDGIDNDNNGYIDDLHGWNFGQDQLNNQVAPGTTSPFQGHGTHVAGIIAGAHDSQGNSGVAYDAQIMALRLGDTDANGVFPNAGELADAINYAVDNGADVINLSLGWSDSQALQTALARAAEQNVVIVSASGNSGGRKPTTPARHAIYWGLSVGAIDETGELAAFSNRAGKDPTLRHVLAPGGNIVSAEPGDRYRTRSGTSMAAPYVSGIVALMLEANPELTQLQIRDILTGTAIPLTSVV